MLKFFVFIFKFVVVVFFCLFVFLWNLLFVCFRVDVVVFYIAAIEARRVQCTRLTWY